MCSALVLPRMLWASSWRVEFATSYRLFCPTLIPLNLTQCRH